MLIKSKHLKGRSVPPVCPVFAQQWIVSFSCFKTLSVFIQWPHPCRSVPPVRPVSRHISYSVKRHFFDSQRICNFSCFKTLSVFNRFCLFLLFTHTAVINISRDWWKIVTNTIACKNESRDLPFSIWTASNWTSSIFQPPTVDCGSRPEPDVSDTCDSCDPSANGRCPCPLFPVATSL